MDKETVEKQIELQKLMHESKMISLEYMRVTEKLKHGWELERIRIKTAEIRKAEERRAIRENHGRDYRPPRQ